MEAYVRMRQLGALAVALVLAALMPHLVIAQQPAETPAPPGTPAACDWFDPLCHRVRLPIVRRDRPPTPRPTTTPPPQLVCRQRLYDGSFEEKDSGWTVRKTKAEDSALVRVGIDRWPAAHGDRMFYLEPATDSDVGITSRDIPGWKAGAVESATLSFSWAVGSYDGWRYSDNMRVYVYEVGGEHAVALGAWYNHQGSDHWTRESFDVKALLNRGWKQVRVNFSAHSDGIYDTWWDIDAVSLDVCAWE